MARIARVVAPGIPHHLTQRGNRRQETFLCAEDYQAYIGLMREWCGYWKVEVWAYCLMPNHAHVIAVPTTKEGLVSDWKGFLCAEAPADDVRKLRRHERTGRPLGTEQFITDVERALHRTLRRGKPGPKRSGDS
jgi:putative transposase